MLSNRAWIVYTYGAFVTSPGGPYRSQMPNARQRHRDRRLFPSRGAGQSRSRFQLGQCPPAPANCQARAPSHWRMNVCYIVSACPFRSVSACLLHSRHANSRQLGREGVAWRVRNDLVRMRVRPCRPCRQDYNTRASFGGDWRVYPCCGGFVTTFSTSSLLMKSSARLAFSTRLLPCTCGGETR